MGGSYLARDKDRLVYLPWIPVSLMVGMIVGVAVWSHFASVAVNRCKEALDYLAADAKDLSPVEQALVATSTVYMIFGTAIFGLALWRHFMLVGQDLQGQLADRAKAYVIANAVLQFVWWLIMLWLVVLMMGMAAWCMVIYVGKQAVDTVLSFQQTQPPPVLAPTDPALCPAACLNLQQFDAFITVVDTRSCVCATDTLQAVVDLAGSALNTVAGILVGIWFMYVSGDFLKSSLWYDCAQSLRDNDTSLRLESSGTRGGKASFARI